MSLDKWEGMARVCEEKHNSEGPFFGVMTPLTSVRFLMALLLHCSLLAGDDMNPEELATEMSSLPIRLAMWLAPS